MGITFTDSQIDSVFPFHLEINDQEQIISQGKSILKIIGDIKNTHFYTHFLIQRPYLENECFDAVLKEKTQFFILSES
jgi:hypothetical protein